MKSLDGKKRRRSTRIPFPRYPHLPVVLTILIGTALSAIAFGLVKNLEVQRMQANFERISENRISAFKRGVESILHDINSIKAFYAGSVMVERDEFQEYVKPLLDENPGILAFEWIPRIPASLRMTYEEKARQNGILGFQITERSRDGQIRTAAQRAEYFPVYFVEPYHDNKAALGFDLASDPTSLEALSRSRDTGEITATARIRLIHDVENRFGFRIFLPIYKKGKSIDSVADRRENIEGFVLGVFRVGDIMKKALTYLDPQGIDIYLYDDSAPEDERFLYFHPSPSWRRGTPPIIDESAALQMDVQHSSVFNMADREWRILCLPTPGYISAEAGRDSLAVLLAGLLFTSLIAAYFLVSIARTTELRTANELLEKEIAERERAEESLRASEDRYRRLSENLEETVKEKVAELQQAESLAAIGQMVSTVAHEVRNPLQNIQLGVDSMKKTIGEDKDKARILDEIQYGVKMLNETISELLEYSKPVKLQYSSHQIADIVDRALQTIRHKLDNVTVRLELENGEDKIRADGLKVAAVLVNLISNAVDAMPFGGNLNIKSRYEKTDGVRMLKVSVSDSGCGINEEDLERVQKPFVSTKIHGAGLGIPVCKKIIRAHGGHMILQSRANEGTTVDVTLPVSDA